MDSKDYTPLVSGRAIRKMTMDRTQCAWKEQEGLFGEDDLSVQIEGALLDLRAPYEARYQQDAATIAALMAEVDALKDAGNNMRQRIIHRVPNIDIDTGADLALYNAIHAWTDALTAKTD